MAPCVTPSQRLASATLASAPFVAASISIRTCSAVKPTERCSPCRTVAPAPTFPIWYCDVPEGMSLSHKCCNGGLGGCLGDRRKGLLRRLAVQDLAECVTDPGGADATPGFYVQQCAAERAWRFLDLGDALGDRPGLFLGQC